jgi:hypothetical protein
MEFEIFTFISALAVGLSFCGVSLGPDLSLAWLFKNTTLTTVAIYLVRSVVFEVLCLHLTLQSVVRLFILTLVESMGTGGFFAGEKARPGLDADHSPPSSAEIKYE